MNKTIAFVTGQLEAGGIERVINNIANKIINCNYSVIIISTKGNKGGYNFDERIKIYSLRHDSKINHVTRVIKKTKELHEIIKKENVKVILSFGAFVTMFAVCARIGTKSKLVVSERTDPKVAPQSKILRHIRNLAYSFADVLVFQTKDAQSYFNDKIKKKSLIIVNPIKEELPPPYKGQRDKIFVNFCRLSKQKNLPLLFDAFTDFWETHNEYKLIIYGEGELKEELVGLIQKLKMSDNILIKNFENHIHDKIVTYTGFVSSSDYEGISNSMLEALAIGLPCICTDCRVGGARMFIKHGENGLLVPVGDKKALTDAMCTIADNVDIQNLFSEKSILIKEQFSCSKIVAMWENCIESLI